MHSYLLNMAVHIETNVLGSKCCVKCPERRPSTDSD